jgi:hypothetical protein
VKNSAHLSRSLLSLCLLLFEIYTVELNFYHAVASLRAGILQYFQYKYWRGAEACTDCGYERCELVNGQVRNLKHSIQVRFSNFQASNGFLPQFEPMSLIFKGKHCYTIKKNTELEMNFYVLFKTIMRLIRIM